MYVIAPCDVYTRRFLSMDVINVACRNAKEEAIGRIEEKSRALQSMHEQVTADLARVDQQNKRELQISDQMLASMQVLPTNLGLGGTT